MKTVSEKYQYEAHVVPILKNQLCIHQETFSLFHNKIPIAYICYNFYGRTFCMFLLFLYSYYFIERCRGMWLCF